MASYDIIVIGSGLGGLTAGLFAVRHGLSTLIMEANIPGGHLTSIEKIEDFPGFPDGIAGYDLCPAVQRQAADHGAEFERAEVRRMELQDRFWSVVTEQEKHLAKAVIVATGSSLKNLEVPGEAELMGRGVSHCASCDGPLYNGQVVGVVGGGDSALQEALALANYAEQIIVLHKGESFSAQDSYRQRVLANEKIVPRYHTAVEEILGDDRVTGVRVRNLKTSEGDQVFLSAVFVYIGLKPNTELLRDLVNLSPSGHIPTDVSMQTERSGLYAAGDIRERSSAQAISAAGDGATAAMAAHRYIKERFEK